MTPKEQRQAIFRFSTQLFLVLSVGLAIHWSLLSLNHFQPKDAFLLRAYGFNFVLAWAIVSLIFWFYNAVRTYVGFLFLAGSTLKILVFFLVFRPIYLQDGQITLLESGGFFVPYLIALFMETRALVRFLIK